MVVLKALISNTDWTVVMMRVGLHVSNNHAKEQTMSAFPTGDLQNKSTKWDFFFFSREQEDDTNTIEHIGASRFTVITPSGESKAMTSISVRKRKGFLHLFCSFPQSQARGSLLVRLPRKRGNGQKLSSKGTLEGRYFWHFFSLFHKRKKQNKRYDGVGGYISARLWNL